MGLEEENKRLPWCALYSFLRLGKDDPVCIKPPTLLRTDSPYHPAVMGLDAEYHIYTAGRDRIAC